MGRTTLVTGAGGFAGNHLEAYLKQQNEAVYGTSRTAGEEHIQIDLLDSDAVTRLIERLKPDVIYHAAAFSSQANSFKQPAQAVGETATMQINLYEACLKLGLQPKFLVISSGQIYGQAAMLPLTEESRLDFASPYAVSKVTQEHLADFYAHRGIESIIARPFNHIGPGQKLGFLVSDLSRQIAILEATSEDEPLMVGNLSSRRDFTDVRDIVRAYSLLIQHGQPGQIYNVCSGVSVSGQEILNQLLQLARRPIAIKPDPARMRPSDIPDLYGDHTKLSQATGWQPSIKLAETLRETLDYWRRKVSEEHFAA